MGHELSDPYDRIVRDDKGEVKFDINGAPLTERVQLKDVCRQPVLLESKANCDGNWDEALIQGANAPVICSPCEPGATCVGHDRSPPTPTLGTCYEHCTSVVEGFSKHPASSPPWGFFTNGAPLSTPHVPYADRKDYKGWLVGMNAAMYNEFEIRAPRPTPTFMLPAASVSLHPGALPTHARWTAPSTGKFLISATFTGRSDGPNWTTTGVSITVNESQIAKGTINGATYKWSFLKQVELSTNDRVDFILDNGNGEFGFDTTGLDAIICSIP